MCGERYRLSHIEGEERTATSSLFGGTAFHAAIEAALHAREAGTAQLEVDYAAGFFMDGWKAAEARYEAELTDGFESLRWDDPKEKVAVHIYTAFEDFYMNVLPTLPKPQAIELYFNKLLVAPGVDIEGTIDFTYVDEDGNAHILDWKTSSRAYVKSDVEKDLQASMYSLAYRELFGKAPETFTFHVWVKGNSPRHEEYPTRRTDQQLARFIWLLERWAEQVRAGVFSPNTSGWWCSDRWCSFHAACPAGGGAPGGGAPVLSLPSPSVPGPLSKSELKRIAVQSSKGGK